MQGSVYRLLVTGVDDSLPHPYVVVLTFSGNKDCIVVPAYSADGHKVHEAIKSDQARGLSDHQIFVRMDNAAQIDFAGSFPGKDAIWCVTRSRRLSQRDVSGSTLIGQMKPPALLKVATTLLAWAEAVETDLSPNAIKALRNMIKALAAQVEGTST